MSPHPAAADWIARLDLSVLPGESGWWAPVHRSAIDVGTGSPACNAIYYLLEPSRPINAWHWLASDDTHVLIDGGPVEYVVVGPDGQVSTTVVSRLAQPMITVPGGSHKALRLVDPDGFALMGSVVAPAWTPQGTVIGPPTIRSRPTWLTDQVMAELTSGVRQPG